MSGVFWLGLAAIFGWCASTLNVGSRWFADLARACRTRAAR